MEILIGLFIVFCFALAMTWAAVWVIFVMIYILFHVAWIVIWVLAFTFLIGYAGSLICRAVDALRKFFS